MSLISPRPDFFVTGASGFLGRAVIDGLGARNLGWTALARRGPFPSWVEFDLSRPTEIKSQLSPGSTIIHCAAQVPARGIKEAAFRQVNVDGTSNLVRQAAEAGARRFVFVSSIKVNGETTLGRGRFTHADVPAPEDAYARSKRDAEDAVRQHATASGLEFCIIRPPATYGAGGRGNVNALIRAAARGLPLPLGGAKHPRALVHVQNLADFVVTCALDERAANQLFLVSDGKDISVSALLALTADIAGQRNLTLPLPEGLLRAGLDLLGLRQASRKLFDPLEISIAHTINLLNWTPPLTAEAAVRRTVCSTSSRMQNTKGSP